MEANVDMLRAAVKGGIPGEIVRTHIITEQCWFGGGLTTKIGQKLLDPRKRLSGAGERNIFGLGGRESDHWLFGTGPGNWAAEVERDKARETSSIAEGVGE